MDEMRWFSDYFLRSTFLNGSGQMVAFAYQVGSGSVDHSCWGPSELESSTQYPRPAWLATTSTPAAGMTASAAAALAVMSILTTSSDPGYSATCLKYAKALYSFARANPGTGYSGGFRNSSDTNFIATTPAGFSYLTTGGRRGTTPPLSLRRWCTARTSRPIPSRCRSPTGRWDR